MPIAVLVLVTGQIVFRESREETDEPFPDPVGSGLLLVGVSLGILALVQSPSWNWLDAVTLTCLALSALVMWALVTRSLRHPRPVVDFGLFRHRNFALLTTGAFVLGVSWFGAYFVLVQFLRNQWHYGLLEAGLLVSPIPFGAGVLAPLCGRVADRIGYRVLVMSGGAAFTLASAWMLLMVTDDPSVARWLPGVILMADRHRHLVPGGAGRPGGRHGARSVRGGDGVQPDGATHRLGDRQRHRDRVRRVGGLRGRVRPDVQRDARRLDDAVRARRVAALSHRGRLRRDASLSRRGQRPSKVGRRFSAKAAMPSA